MLAHLSHCLFCSSRCVPILQSHLHPRAHTHRALILALVWCISFRAVSPCAPTGLLIYTGTLVLAIAAGQHFPRCRAWPGSYFTCVRTYTCVLDWPYTGRLLSRFPLAPSFGSWSRCGGHLSRLLLLLLLLMLMQHGRLLPCLFGHGRELALYHLGGWQQLALKLRGPALELVEGGLGIIPSVALCRDVLGCTTRGSVCMLVRA